MPRRADRPILEDILAYAQEAVEFVAALHGDLADDRMRLLAVARTAEIVGEAASQLSDAGRVAVNYDLSQAIAMRHRLIHGYDTVSAAVVTQTVREDFPPLIEAVKVALSSKLPDET